MRSLIRIVLLATLALAGCARTPPPITINPTCVALVLAVVSPEVAETVLACMDRQTDAECVRQAMAMSSELALKLLPCLQPPPGETHG